MTDLVEQLQRLASGAIAEEYGTEVPAADIVIRPTRSDQDGDYTIVTFALAKALRDKPDAIAAKVGAALEAAAEPVAHTGAVKGFLNVSLADAYWRDALLSAARDPRFGLASSTGQRTMVEYSSPNTNKPLHLGHVRNILLGWSTSRILEAAGHEVVRVQIINDRGIAICKSMLAWQRFGDGATPESARRKGDHLVGDYYVRFEREFRAEYEAWQASEAGRARLADVPTKEGETAAKAFRNTYFNEVSELGGAAREMLRAWEAGDPEVRSLWAQMNGWVYAGHNATYERLGAKFDKLYYESDTYLLGREMVARGVERGTFYRKGDGSVWVDLTDAGLDEKIVLRSDGTAVYITQDLGTAHLRYEDFGVDAMIYVVGDEQNYHFQVLFETLRRLGEPYAERLSHVGYGMIDLTTGRMKGREGTIVDADELMDEVVGEARASAEERAEAQGQALVDAAEEVGLAAIKYYILRVGPKKRMTFDPKESVDLQGNTGPYILYSYVRARGVSAKAAASDAGGDPTAYTGLGSAERELVKHLLTLPDVIATAAEELDPSLLAAYAYNLAKGYHRFWHDHSVLSAESAEAGAFRVALSGAVAQGLRTAMDLLGIALPERM